MSKRIVVQERRSDAATLPGMAMAHTHFRVFLGPICHCDDRGKFSLFYYQHRPDDDWRTVRTRCSTGMGISK